MRLSLLAPLHPSPASSSPKGPGRLGKHPFKGTKDFLVGNGKEIKAFMAAVPPSPCVSPVSYHIDSITYLSIIWFPFLSKAVPSNIQGKN